MKNFSAILFSTLFTCLLFSTVLYTACNKSDKCDGIVCKNGGTCNNGTCTCPSGYEGSLCETKTDPCKNVTCLNGGTCLTDGSCHCPAGFGGKQCEIDLCDTITCLNGGICVTGACQCPEGYEGPRCETETRARYLGVWTGITSCSSSDKDTVVITLSAANPASYVTVGYAGKNEQFNVSAKATATGLSMSQMQYIDNGRQVGFGMIINGDVATFSFTIHDVLNNTSEQCTGSAKR